MDDLGDAGGAAERVRDLDQPCRGERCDSHVGLEVSKGPEEMALAGTQIERVEPVHRRTGNGRIEEVTKAFLA